MDQIINTIKPLEILLAEDNPHDITFVKKSFSQGRLLNNLHVVQDGEEALDFLYKRGNFIQAPRPDLILLDLNMPNIDGQEVLEDIKNNPDLRRIPTIVLTSSDLEKDIVDAYNAYVNAYIVKPVNFHNFMNVVKKIEDFWLVLAKRPPK